MALLKDFFLLQASLTLQAKQGQESQAAGVTQVLLLASSLQ